MSRSCKYAPFIGICPASTAKPYKRLTNRCFRSMEGAAVRGDGEPCISTKITPDPRLMAYDGKWYGVGTHGKALRK